jgi:4-amino-4-deoxy-L-arabinose transferase-like glycosyltransferase
MAKKRKRRRSPATRVPRGKQAADAVKGARRDAKQTMPEHLARRLGLALDLILAAIVLVFVVKSAVYSSRARFLTDECFHTYIVETIIADGNSPVDLSELYSGMRNNTHPLFHWLAVPFYLVKGRAALPYFNVVLSAVMLGLLYWLLRAWVTAAAARIAVAVTLLFDVIYICTQAFYVEVLSALTFVLAVFGLYVAFGLPEGGRRRFDWKLPFLAGCGTGLCLLSKQTGYVVLPVLVVLFVFFLVTLRWRRALGVALAGVTAVATFGVGMNALSQKPIERFRAIYASVEHEMVPRPLRLFKSTKRRPPEPYDPSGDLQPSGGGLAAAARDRGADDRAGGDGGAGSTEAEARKALHEGHGHRPGEMLRLWRQVLGAPGLILLAVCIAHLLLGVVVWALRALGVDARLPVGPPGATTPFVLSILSLLVSAILIGTAGSRHFIPTIPVLAACTGIAVTDLLRMAGRSRTAAVTAATGLALAVSAIAVLLVPDYREPALGEGERTPAWVKPRWGTLAQNAPQDLIAAAEAIRDDGTYPTAVVHAMWTSATWYYSGHPATWGSVNVPQFNSVMLQGKLWSAFKRHAHMGIRYYMVSNYAVDISGSPVPLGYTPQFFDNVTRMLRAGAMRIIYPADLAEQQERLLAQHAFDRVFIPGQREPTVFDLTRGYYTSMPANTPIIWGNPGLRTIVIKLDYRRFWTLPSSLADSPGPPEPPDR